jgi:hypothetical protein
MWLADALTAAERGGGDRLANIILDYILDVAP